MSRIPHVSEDASEAVIQAVGRARAEGRPVRLLFVCTGNICRSPMAEATLMHEAGGDRDLFECDSAGTHGYHTGDNADPRMRKCALKHGVEINHLARRVGSGDLENFDIVFAMDGDHLRYLHEKAADSSQRRKVVLYRDFDSGSDVGKDVPDPYYEDNSAFEEVYQITLHCTKNILKAFSAVDYIRT